MRGLLAVLCLAALVGCASGGAAGRMPAHLVRNTGGAIPGQTALLRSVDGSSFSETEVAVEMDAVPGPARAQRTAACPNREGGVRFARMEVNGADAFKVYAGQGLRTCAVVTRPDGVRIRVEEALDPTTLPGPITTAVEGMFHDDYEIAEAWQIQQQDGEQTIEVVVRKYGRELLLVLATNGTVRQRLRRLPAVLVVPDR